MCLGEVGVPFYRPEAQSILDEIMSLQRGINSSQRIGERPGLERRAAMRSESFSIRNDNPILVRGSQNEAYQCCIR